MDTIYPFHEMGQHIQNAVADLPHQVPQATYAGPSWEEMEAKRQEMITSFKDIAAAMTRCVAIIEDYTRLTPSNLALDSGSLDTFNIGQADVKGGKKAADDKKKKKKEKKPRDPNAPRRPPSAYLLFQNEQREGIKQTNPNMAYKDILMHVAEKWKNLTPEQKKVYEDAYAEANEEYRRADDAYKTAGSVAVAKAVVAPAAEEASSDDSDSDSDTSDSDAPPKKAAQPVPQAVPPTLLAADGAAKKEKKRKNKDEAVVTPQADGEKKKKKKSKE